VSIPWHIFKKIIFYSRSKESKQIVRKSNFDGFYTFNASNGASFFSTFKNWEKLKKFADMYNLIFVPTVAPGYHDSKAKFNPMRRFRSNGMYFECELKFLF
jgi:glycoprotein endo-alpha-1,2-mannosidase